ncbi:methanethiol oxidase-like [Littorina saxatilis]|uniref:Methanethiol oxidase n=2 Tax=Littorina saxatilis TaxID=31220 RepID=A0AAN9ANX3_9CAEN
MPGDVGVHKGPGYASPQEAIKKAPREQLMYCMCIVPPSERHRRHDYVSVVDLDPKSPTFCQVLSRWHAPYKGDELHHFGWNVCSSCHGDCKKVRNRIIMPCFNSDRIYVLDVGTNPKHPELFRVVEPAEVHKKTGLGAPHTSHCLGSGQVMISCAADASGNGGKSGFILLDGETFDIVDNWEKGTAVPKFGYDFWYQPRHNVMVSTSFGAPKVWRKGFDNAHVDQGLYGRSLHVWDWKSRTLKQNIDLGKDGLIPLEVRFLHNPDAAEGFVGAALGSSMFRFFKKPDGSWDAEKVVDIPNKTVQGWTQPDMPSLVTFFLISMDDRFLYLSNWLHGDIRQYDITDTRKPKLVGQIFVGGQLCRDKGLKVLKDPEGHVKDHTEPLHVKGKRIEGGPQMLQLSLDGKRLYVCNSLLSVWDNQFYPDLPRNGSQMLQIDCNTEKGGMKLNKEFLVDFGNEPDGPTLVHEIRYNGGDCTSDIWV